MAISPEKKRDSSNPASDALTALEMVPPVRKPRKTLWKVGIGIGIGFALLALVPWQQSVVGNGRVGVYDLMSRPQAVEAQISGRLVEWKVQEGEPVKKGQVIAVLRDIESRFLAVERVKQTREQLRAQTSRRDETARRAAAIRKQIASQEQSQGNQIQAAEQGILVAERQRKIAEQQRDQAQKALDATSQVAQAQAKQQVLEAEDRLEQTRQSLIAARENYEKEKDRRARIGRLYAEGLRSGQEDEFAERDLVGRLTALRGAEKSVDAARRMVEIRKATTVGADIEVQRARIAVLNANDQIQIADRNVQTARFNRSRIENDTAASISSSQGSLQSALESLESTNDSIAKASMDLANIEGRVEQQSVIAPATGRLSRAGKAVGPGETVKAGDVLAEIVPETRDQAAELILSGVDAPLVTIGRKVRLQFNGFPAVQINGFPQAAVGTFSGVVTQMDPQDDGTGRVRIWVKPDAGAIAGGAENAWPKSDRLRPGTDCIGWVLLERVPLWWELWRQFNAFPPNFRDTDTAGKAKDKDGEKDAKSAKPMKDGDIKLPKR